MEERFETFTVLIARISRSIKRIKADEMADFELKGPHVSCLYYLSQQDGMTAAELCERCDEDKAAISRSLDDLEKNGYITCASGAGKRYKSPLRLTERGKAVGRAIGEKIMRIVEAASEGLSEAERQAALVLSESVFLGQKMVAEGETDANKIVAAMTEHIQAQPLAKIDYVSAVDGVTMDPVDRIAGTVLVAMAVYIGKTRLIDNFIVEGK